MSHIESTTDNKKHITKADVIAVRTAISFLATKHVDEKEFKTINDLWNHYEAELAKKNITLFKKGQRL